MNRLNGNTLSLTDVYSGTISSVKPCDFSEHPTMTLAAILVWVVIFNHKAESPTYIIAMMGIGISTFPLPILLETASVPAQWLPLIKVRTMTF